MILIGIDPGLRGAACALCNDFGSVAFLDVIDLPTLPDGEKRQIDGAALGAWLEKIEPDHAFIENVQPMPSIPGPAGDRRTMGAASSFRFGMACGQIRGVVVAYQIPLTLTVPRVWKRHFNLKGPEKEKSIMKAISLLPKIRPFLQRRKDDNRAEAALLALYGFDKLGML